MAAHADHPTRIRPLTAARRNDAATPRRPVAWARGAGDVISDTRVTVSEIGTLGPYETRYDICRGYCSEREIIRP